MSEVQSQRDASFAERMFAYYASLFVQHRLPTVSLAMLGDDRLDALLDAALDATDVSAFIAEIPAWRP